MTSEYTTLLRNDFLSFAMKAHLELHGGQALDDDKYLQVIAADLEQLGQPGRRRMMFNCRLVMPRPFSSPWRTVLGFWGKSLGGEF